MQIKGIPRGVLWTGGGCDQEEDHLQVQAEGTHLQASNQTVTTAGDMDRLMQVWAEGW